MTTQTFSDGATKVLASGNPLVVELLSDSGADAQPGFHVEHTAEFTCGLAGASSVIGIGICSDIGHLAIDSAIAENGVCRIYLWGSSAFVNGYLEQGSGTATIGQRLVAGATTAGTMDLAGDLSAVDLRTQYGRAGEYLAQHASDEYVFKINLSV